MRCSIVPIIRTEQRKRDTTNNPSTDATGEQGSFAGGLESQRIDFIAGEFDMSNIIRLALKRRQQKEQERALRREQNRAIAELMSYSDYELADLGLARSDIENAVKYGRAS